LGGLDGGVGEGLVRRALGSGAFGGTLARALGTCGYNGGVLVIAGTNTTTLTYDNNGNLASDQYGCHPDHDAWNRLPGILDDGVTVLQLCYDGPSQSASRSRKRFASPYSVAI
jgi:hypothetical protein